MHLEEAVKTILVVWRSRIKNIKFSGLSHLSDEDNISLYEDD